MSSTTTEERQVLSAVYDYCSKKNDGVFTFKRSDLLDDTDGRLSDYIVHKLKGRCGTIFGWKLTRKVFRLLDGSLREKKFIKKKEDGDYKMMDTRVKKVCVIVVVL